MYSNRSWLENPFGLSHSKVTDVELNSITLIGSGVAGSIIKQNVYEITKQRIHVMQMLKSKTHSTSVNLYLMFIKRIP